MTDFSVPAADEDADVAPAADAAATAKTGYSPSSAGVVHHVGHDRRGGGGVQSTSLCCSGFVPSCGSFSIQYNYACASIAVEIMLSHSDVAGDVAPDFPEPPWAKEFLLCFVFVGSVVGMLSMGYLGDLLGVSKALVISNAFVVVGALASALLSWGPPEEVWLVISISRFLLGVGVGGNYPLSAAKAAAAAEAEGRHAHSEVSPDQVVAKTAGAFFWQGPGAVAPYLVALALLQLPPTPGVTSVQFRVLFALGAVPALVVLVPSWQEARRAGNNGDTPQSSVGRGDLRSDLRSPRHWRTLAGTAGAWLLFDVAYYGTVIFTPDILERTFGSDMSLTGLSARAAFVHLIGVAGVFSGLLALPRIGAKALCTAGLALSGIFFLACMLLLSYYPTWHRSTFSALCVLIFILASGPNVATYVLPVMSFPPEVRSTFHGLSSAAAKVGAMLGALLFPPIADAFGVPAVMATQAAICAAGAVLSHTCLRSEGYRTVGDASGSSGGSAGADAMKASHLRGGDLRDQTAAPATAKVDFISADTWGRPFEDWSPRHPQAIGRKAAGGLPRRHRRGDVYCHVGGDIGVAAALDAYEADISTIEPVSSGASTEISAADACVPPPEPWASMPAPANGRRSAKAIEKEQLLA